MLVQTLSFSSAGKLSTRHEQMVYEGEDGIHRTFPIEDIGMVIIESAQLSITSACLQKLVAANVAVVVCDEKHLPTAQLQAYAAHTTAQETMQAQLAASDAVQGRLWRQITKQKILNQATILKRLNKNGAKRLEALAEAVKNGDPQNCEAQAARIYFQALQPTPNFRRDPIGDWPNPALNYGYAILRATIARALVGSGLICFKGIHHHNRYNPFCLADDMMEPFRPFVDQYVFGGEAPFDGSETSLTKPMKVALLQMITCDVQMGEVKRPLMIAATFATASLAHVYLGKTKQLNLPEFVS